MSPQFTEHPPQLPRGEEAGTLQEFPAEERSEAGGPEPVVLGGPAVSLAAPRGSLPLVAHPAQTSSIAAKAAVTRKQDGVIAKVLVSVAVMG